MRKISFPNFKSHLGLISDIGGVLGFVGMIKALFFSDWSSSWSFLLRLDWILGTMAYWVLFGWLYLLLLFFSSLWSVVRWVDWHFGGRTISQYIETPTPEINWYGFIAAAAWRLVSIVSGLIAGRAKQKKRYEKLRDNVFWGTYLVAASIVGVYFALTIPEEHVNSYGPLGMSFLIRPLGWIALPLLVFLMCVLLVKGLKLLFSLFFTTKETDEEAKG